MNMNITSKVKKPVEAIQCANTFSLLQRKMYNVLLANAAGNLYPDMTHRITMKVLCGLMGYVSNDYKTIKQKFRELRRMDIEWDVINENGNKVWTNTSPLSLARVIEGEGICEYEFTPSLIPFLDRPAQYAKFSLVIQSKFKSGYGLALYENCERYRNIGYTRLFDVPTFRKLMGVEESQYIEFFALKRRVIATAIKEVNQYADFDVEPEYEKKGRVIVAIRFLIKNKTIEMANDSQPANQLLGTTEKEDKFIEMLTVTFGLKKRDIDKYVKKYGREYLRAKAETIINSESFEKGLIKSMAGYFKTALVEDFQPNLSSKTVAESRRRDKENALTEEKKQEEKLSQLKKAYDYYLAREIGKLISSIRKPLKHKILKAFEQTLGISGYLSIFQKEGLDNLLIADRFIEFARIKYPELLHTMMSFDDYLKNLSENIVSV